MKKVVALILGGGQGKRLFPLTKYRSKPAVPIGGKYRLIDIPISNCLHSGIKDIYVLSQFNSESLNNHINNTYRFDYFSRAFVRILAAEQTLENTTWYQGTADAVRRSISHIGIDRTEQVLILSGDHLYRMDYRQLVGFHRSHKADFTVSVIPVRKSETREYGIVKLNRENRITVFKEKLSSPRELQPLVFHGKANLEGKSIPSPAYLASMGVYLFNSKALKSVLDSKDVDFGKEIIPNSIRHYKAAGFVFNDYWRDVGTIKAFYEVNIDFTLSRPHFSFFGEDRVFTRPRFLPPAVVSGTKIENCLIADGCIVHKGAKLDHTVIGLRTVIGEGCKISRTVIMGADYYENERAHEGVRLGIGAGSWISGAIIDKNAHIGKDVVIKNLKRVHEFDDENYYIRDGIVIIPKNAVIPNNTKI